MANEAYLARLKQGVAAWNHWRRANLDIKPDLWAHLDGADFGGVHIGDFRQWKDHDAYQKAFQRLLRDLKADIRLTPANERLEGQSCQPSINAPSSSVCRASSQP